MTNIFSLVLREVRPFSIFVAETCNVWCNLGNYCELFSEHCGLAGAVLITSATSLPLKHTIHCNTDITRLTQLHSEQVVLIVQTNFVNMQFTSLKNVLTLFQSLHVLTVHFFFRRRIVKQCIVWFRFVVTNAIIDPYQGLPCGYSLVER